MSIAVPSSCKVVSILKKNNILKDNDSTLYRKGNQHFVPSVNLGLFI